MVLEFDRFIYLFQLWSMPIERLPEMLVAQIAAGEVIESPVGVLKELIENSIDASSHKIEITVEDDGYKKIQIRDDGTGIQKFELKLAPESYTTSKLQKLEDLFDLHSLGFRGEALSAIRSVSQMTIESKPACQDLAYQVRANPDNTKEPKVCALPAGTRIIVEDLFFNAPVRRDFFKNRRSLKKSIIDLITHFAISLPTIHFELTYNGKTELQLLPKEKLFERLIQIFGKELGAGIIPVYSRRENPEFEIEGFISNFNYYKTSGSFIHFFVNNRIVSYNKLVGMFKRVYGELMPPGRFPVAFLFLKSQTDQIDVNVHPQKKKIRFINESTLDSFLSAAIRSAIEGHGPLKVRQLQHPKRAILTAETAEAVQDSVDNLKINFTNNLFEKSKNEDYNSLDEHEEQERALPTVAHARLFQTFVLASSEEGLFLIDQHTAHERINYELFLDKLEKKENVKQKLIAPIPIDLSPAESSLLNDKLELLENLGFDVENLGPIGFNLLSVPFYTKTGEEQNTLFAALKLINEPSNDSVSAIELFDELAKTLACHHSIRKGDDESVENLSDLIERLNQCKQPWRCPHGRPTIVFLGKKDLFSLFKRFI